MSGVMVAVVYVLTFALILAGLMLLGGLFWGGFIALVMWLLDAPMAFGKAFGLGLLVTGAFMVLRTLTR